MMSNFLNGEPQTATEQHVSLRWSGRPPGQRFRCHMCGHRFKVGDYWRFVLTKVWTNILVCQECDGEDIQERWAQKIEELRMQAWWLWEDAYND